MLLIKKLEASYYRCFKFFLTGVEGIEPSLKVLETSVIPFDHTPMYFTLFTTAII